MDDFGNILPLRRPSYHSPAIIASSSPILKRAPALLACRLCHAHASQPMRCGCFRSYRFLRDVRLSAAIDKKRGAPHMAASIGRQAARKLTELMAREMSYATNGTLTSAKIAGNDGDHFYAAVTSIAMILPGASCRCRSHQHR